jgi:hypothetical protein
MSSKNERKAHHREAAIEAIRRVSPGQGHPVEPPRRAGGWYGRHPTVFYFVSISEEETEPIRCIVGISNDPPKTSLDGNVTPEKEMHPAVCSRRSKSWPMSADQARRILPHGLV